MSKLPNYEKRKSKIFHQHLRAYGLNQQRENNIGVVRSSTSKTKVLVLAYQPKQGGHHGIAKCCPQQLETYAFQTYLDLSYFFESWAKYKRFKCVPLIGPNNTPPTCWRLWPKGYRSWWSMYLVEGEVDSKRNQPRQGECPTILWIGTNKKI